MVGGITVTACAAGVEGVRCPLEFRHCAVTLASPREGAAGERA